MPADYKIRQKIVSCLFRKAQDEGFPNDLWAARLSGRDIADSIAEPFDRVWPNLELLTRNGEINSSMQDNESDFRILPIGKTSHYENKHLVDGWNKSLDFIAKPMPILFGVIGAIVGLTSMAISISTCNKQQALQQEMRIHKQAEGQETGKTKLDRYSL